MPENVARSWAGGAVRTGAALQDPSKHSKTRACLIRSSGVREAGVG